MVESDSKERYCKIYCRLRAVLQVATIVLGHQGIQLVAQIAD